MLDAEFLALTHRKASDVFKPEEVAEREQRAHWGETPEAQAGVQAVKDLSARAKGK